VATDRLPLRRLRSVLCVVPQQPFLFKGTVRFNLDPFDRETDQSIWAALEKTHMRDVIAGMEGGLDAQVAERGANLSAGQRQLLCLARAILIKAKIVVRIFLFILMLLLAGIIGLSLLVCRQFLVFFFSARFSSLLTFRVKCVDEATANVDLATDALVQQTLASEFRDSTLIIIAHRINTLMSCDRIAVMDAGTVVEFDKPERLQSPQWRALSSQSM
jgi:ABC-type multidrug transport system fused ATPase/permease subunit